MPNTAPNNMAKKVTINVTFKPFNISSMPIMPSSPIGLNSELLIASIMLISLYMGRNERLILAVGFHVSQCFIDASQQFRLIF